MGGPKGPHWKRMFGRKPTCPHCKGTGAVELPAVADLRVVFVEERCICCGGLGVVH